MKKRDRKILNVDRKCVVPFMNDIKNTNNALPYGSQCVRNHDAKAQEAAIELICGELSIDTWRCFRGNRVGGCADENGSYSSTFSFDHQEGCDEDDNEMAFSQDMVRGSGTEEEEDGNNEKSSKRQNQNQNEEEGPQKASAQKRKKKFEERMVELAKYKERFGHCDVPIRYPSLGRWCNEVRASYNILKGHRKNSNRKGLKLDAERIQRLEAMGFRFISALYKTFEEHVEDLKKFKEKYGHCRVNADYPELRSWCYTIRKYRRKSKLEYEKTMLTREQIDLLTDLGFQWTTTRSQTVLERSFQSYIDELKKFQERHGHCNVPRSHSTLGKWCFSVRAAHKRIMMNKKYNKKLTNHNSRLLTLEQIEELDTIGFRWFKSAIT